MCLAFLSTLALETRCQALSSSGKEFFQYLNPKPETLLMHLGGVALRVQVPDLHMGGSQNYGPFLDPSYNTAPSIWGTQKKGP